MYLSRVVIINIRSIGAFVWDLQPEMPQTGWHVILGDNGSGKTTVLQAIALCLSMAAGRVAGVLSVRLLFAHLIAHGDRNDAR